VSHFRDTELRRRDFLRWSAATSSGLALGAMACGDSMPSGGPDAATGADSGLGSDANPQCLPTQDDALGPFFEEGAPMRAKIAADSEPGDRLNLSAQILADDCATPLAGVLVDIWQADRDGAYHDADVEFRLRGQVTSDAEGRFSLETVRPGNYENSPGGWRPAHIHFKFNKAGHSPIVTQIYFAGDPYLAPNDDCGSCGSDDADRIVELTGDGATSLSGNFRVIMKAA